MDKDCYQIHIGNKKRPNTIYESLTMVYCCFNVFIDHITDHNKCYQFRVCNFFMAIDQIVVVLKWSKKIIVDFVKFLFWYCNCNVNKYV
jgi:hypothetical protein